MQIEDVMRGGGGALWRRSQRPPSEAPVESKPPREHHNLNHRTDI
jgi:hypothetical protein